MFGFTKEPEVKLEPAIDKCPYHTRRIFNPFEFKNVARWATLEIEQLRPDAVVACGHSGLLLAGVISFATGVPTFAVRKPNEYTVAGSDMVSGISLHGKAKRWVWLDDFISTGSTLRRCIKEVYHAGLVESPFPAAIMLYNVYKSEKFGEYSVQRLVDDLGGYNGFIPSSIPVIGYLS